LKNIDGKNVYRVYRYFDTMQITLSYRPTLSKMSRQMFLRNTLYNTLTFMLFQAEQSLASTNQWGNVVDGVAVAP